MVTNLTETFNTIRLNNLNKEFSSYEIKSLLSKNNIVPLMLYSFVKAGCIKYNGNRKVRKYFFTENPVYVTKISKAVHFYKESCNKYKNKENKITIEQAIEILKKNNYKIQKPTQFNFDKLKNELGDRIYDYVDYEEC